ncbi:hypothetical protein [Streptomyces sp. NPDC005385]|uniref:hypothetical protein n=1 Tax=Streptomyces sp. NPDC005385 TaxID=3157039 RepID=UPI0033AA3382
MIWLYVLLGGGGVCVVALLLARSLGRLRGEQLPVDPYGDDGHVADDDLEFEDGDLDEDTVDLDDADDDLDADTDDEPLRAPSGRHPARGAFLPPEERRVPRYRVAGGGLLPGQRVAKHRRG